MQITGTIQRPDPLPSGFFRGNRERFLLQMEVGDVVLHSSNSAMPRNGDQYYPFRQHSGFFYLSGIEQAGSLLLSSKEREILFIKKPELKSTLWDGPLLDLEEAAALSGFMEVHWLEDIWSLLDDFLRPAGRLYLNYSGGCERDAFPERDIYRKICEAWPHLEIRSVDPLLQQLRMIKQPEEVECIRKAAGITAEAFRQVLSMVKPGVTEYQVEAELGAVFIRMGARGHAFEPIVASGSNALVLHYVRNGDSCRDGDLLLMDFGAELNNYAADCSRTIPVNGRFSPRQRQVYDTVHRVFLAVRSLMMPGRTLRELHEETCRLWEEEHIRLGLYTAAEASREGNNNPLWKKYYPHGTSHSLGLDVHDPFDKELPLREGMVLTCEPGIYIPEEGLGIRLENDILISKDGPVDLMSDIPMEAGEIEERIRRT